MSLMVDRLGGPSELHESRVDTLVTLATLIGFGGGPDVLPDGFRPDVQLVRRRDGALFVGDAKATETPGNTHTYARLSHYAAFVGAWLSMGRPAVLALAVDTTSASGWLWTLRDVSLGPSSGARVPGHVDFIDAGTAVIWQSFDGRRA